MKPYSDSNKIKYRSIWISDTHMGTKHCHADSLIHFLTSTRSDYLYLVGDIIDLWSIKSNFYWPKKHSEILKLIQSIANNGTKVIYLPGNHDSALHTLTGKKVGNIMVESSVIHKTQDGRNLLVLHGDEVDPLMHAHIGYWLNYFGDKGYDFILFINHYLAKLLKILGIQYWSLSSFIKKNLKNAMKHINTYEHLLVSLARDNKTSGVICGHIHYPCIKNITTIDYYNTGDWVEHCTALTEDFTGEIHLIHWTKMSTEINKNNIETIAA